jgi:DNA-binding beta-propeller fold protein YncE
VKVGAPSDDFEGFAVSPNGNQLWTASPRGKIAIVDTVKKALVQTIDAPGVTGANRVAFTPDGQRVLISRLFAAPGGPSGDIIVYDAATRTEIKRIDAGGGVGGLLMQPDGARAYGSARTGVVVIDLNTL